MGCFLLLRFHLVKFLHLELIATLIEDKILKYKEQYLMTPVIFVIRPLYHVNNSVY
jgi:hypothetical protein